MTISKIKRYPINKLCHSLAEDCTVKEINDQIKRFDQKIVECTDKICDLCLRYSSITCVGCPYYTNIGFYGCIKLSKIRYDGYYYERGLLYFQPKSRISALKRWQLALKIKQS